MFRCAMFRTTWNYFTKFPDFTAWLARVEGQTRLLNVPSIVRWNWDKHYFADLEAEGAVILQKPFEIDQFLRLVDDMLL